MFLFRFLRSIVDIDGILRPNQDKPLVYMNVSNNSQLPDKPDNENVQDNGDDFFLPDFCNVRMVFAVVVIAEMLAIVLTLAPLERAANRWEDLSIISLFIQWVALLSSAVLCLARPWLSKLSDTAAATASYFLMLTTTSLISEVTYWAGHWLFLGPNLPEGWHTNFLIRKQRAECRKQ